MRLLYTLLYTLLLAMACCVANAQERRVQNRPYTDLRPLHFGVIVGTHMQDLELLNAGPQTITADDGTVEETLVSVDQNRWDPGVNVGVLAELRLSTYLQLRIAPTMYFGTRHIVFRDLKNLDADGTPQESSQEMKSAYITCSADMIFAAPRFNNHRPYIMAGIAPMINLNAKRSDNLRLRRSGLAVEAGLGCDFYLPFFKLRPELKFMYGLGNSLDTHHAADLRDQNLKKFAQAVKSAHTKMIVLSFYFE